MVGVGIPGLLEKFSEAELKGEKRVFKLDNFSNRVDFFDRGDDKHFTHAPVEGTLEVEATSQGIMATAHVEKVNLRNYQDIDPEEVKRRIDGRQVQITSANAYNPGSNITLYSYPGHVLTGWSFHCDL